MLMDFNRAANGTLILDSAYATGGTGLGAGLVNQGSVSIAGDGTILVVNAGSNSVSSSTRGNRGLVLKSTVASYGAMPISITEYNNTVFILNAGGNSNISGFNLAAGKLSSIANSTHALVDAGAGPAQVSFVNNGSALLVTEKNANKITRYSVNSVTHSLAWAIATPFGFAAGNNGNIYVSEASGGSANASTVSSYHIASDGSIKLVTGASM